MLGVGDPEIDDLDHLMGRRRIAQKEVRRLQILVDHPLLVGLAQRFQGPHKQRQSPRRRKAPHPTQLQIQVRSLQILHDHIGVAALFEHPEVIDLDDPRVADLGRQAHLAKEAIPNQLAGLSAGADHLIIEHLDRHRPLNDPIEGQIHHRKPPLAQGALQLVAILEDLTLPKRSLLLLGYVFV